ncbi:MAG TPA: hypothetical protein VE861_00845 [Gemmatimonadaceae bacterium]|nr:hypothetical protein [Gemmatimonadaceae bacterium]
MKSRHPLLLVPVLAATLAACAKTDAAPATDSTAPAAASASARAGAASTVAPTLVNIVASDYAYEAPDTITAGLVTLQLVNKGPEMHHVQLFRLTGGKTFADLAAGMKSMKPDAPLPPWMELLAGPNVPGSAEGQQVTQELAPGAYALVCVIPDSKGVPHFALGMMRPLTVISATGPTATVPTADVQVTMSDYAWDVTPVITAGKHVVRLENTAAQPHEMLLVKLEKGKTAADFVQWTQTMMGPPPAAPMGGTSGMQKGTVAYVPVDLPAGEYAMICFLPDAKDGKPHIAHGMVKQFTVS